MKRTLAWGCCLALAAPLFAVAAHAGDDDGRLEAGWTLRAVDCARCHGKDYGGLTAPFIVRYARNVSRDGFAAAVLDGKPARGMPAYRDNSRIADHIDDIYRYFALQ